MRSRFLTYFAAGVVLSATALQAQVSSVAPRVVAPVNDQSLTTLRGNVSPVARAEFDKGEASPSTQLRNVLLVLSRSKEQQAELDSLMAAQLDKNSPDYHRWLTPEEYNRRFGPADSDIAAIVAWLQSHGLNVGAGDISGTNIAFSGSVSQIEKAFRLSMHAFQRNGSDYLANVTEPKIPTALATVVTGVARLSTYAPISHRAKSRPGMFQPGSGFTPTDSASRIPQPELTTSGPFLWITPADAATMYDTPNSYNAAFSSGASYTGQGVTIGIGGVADINPSTVVNYRNRFLNGNMTAPTITNIDGSATIGDATDEAYIDNELAGGLAPGATIHFYTADQNTDGGITTVMNQVIKDNSVDIFSLSFGLCEYFFTNSDNTLIYGLVQQMSLQGIAVTVSTGDNGSAGCDDQNTASQAAYGLQVNGLASTPFNIAVGGTDTYGLISHFSTYVNNNSASTNSYRSVLSYIPEATWNDSAATDGLLANNVPYGYNTGNTNIVGGSGGVSSCSTNTDTNTVLGTCTNGYPKPSWQRGPGVPNDHARDLPDVSLMAGNGLDRAAWLVCIDETDPNYPYPDDCSNQVNGQFYFSGFGGTSTSAPAFAGMLALVQQSLGGSGHRLGADAAKNLYDLFNGGHASAVFHDTQQGNISVYCDPVASPNCKTNTAGYPFLTGYDTTAGYDLATGLGSVDVTNLVKYWSGATGNASATATLTPSATSITIAQSLTVDVTISGGSGTPTGTVILSGGGYTSSTVNLDGAGKASFTIPAGALAAGNDTLTVTYGGDSTYASTTGTTSVTVTKLPATVTVTPASSSIFVNQSLSVTVKVSGSGATPTGTVTLSSGSYTSAATTLTSGSATITIPANSLAVGTASLSASYTGDSAYATATGTGSVTVAALPTPTVTVTPAVSSIFVDQSLSVTVKVSGSGATPTGTVTLKSGSYTSAATSLTSGSATITIPANSLAVGTPTLTASYSGDSAYATATGTGSVTVAAKPTPTVTVTPAASSIFVDQSLSVTVKVAGTGSDAATTPTGTVTLSGGGHIWPAASLTSGSATITIPANTFAVGAVTLTASYSGDTNFGTATGTASVTVAAKLAPVITVTPGSSSIGSDQSLDVTVKVAGAVGTGEPPTGTVTLSATGYTSTATPLPLDGIATITIPANTFSTDGAVTLTASYSGDSIYAAGTSTGSVTINPPYSLTATAPAAISAGGSATSTITVKSDGVYVGTVAMACSLATSPSGAQHLPTCSVTAGSSLSFDTTNTSQTSTVTISTTAATSASLERHGLPRWTGAGGAVLALLVFFGVPSRRRGWRSLLGLLVLIAALGSLSACGGGGSGGGGGGGGGTPGTTAGVYTFTVTGTGAPAITPTPTATVTLTVN
jgi:trimeric autotransporter adhesin